jgi:hypothetical protein
MHVSLALQALYVLRRFMTCRPNRSLESRSYLRISCVIRRDRDRDRDRDRREGLGRAVLQHLGSYSLTILYKYSM